MTAKGKSTLDNGRRDLEQPDGSRTLVWVRQGRIHLAVLGTAAALAAGGVASTGADTPGSGQDQPPPVVAPAGAE